MKSKTIEIRRGNAVIKICFLLWIKRLFGCFEYDVAGDNFEKRWLPTLSSGLRYVQESG